MREDTVGNVEDVARDRLPMVKVKRIASSVNDVSRAEESKESKEECFKVRGNSSALVRLADRQKLRRMQAARRKENMIKVKKGSSRWKNARDLRTNKRGRVGWLIAVQPREIYMGNAPMK